MKLLRDVIKADPRNADARLLLGSLLMEGGQRAGTRLRNLGVGGPACFRNRPRRTMRWRSL